MKHLKHKRGVIDNLSALIIGLGAFAIVAVVIFLIMSELAANTDVAADSNASAAVGEVQSAASDIPGWLPIVVITVIGGVLLLLVRVFRQ